MHFLVLSVICSVLVSVLLKLAPRRGVDIAQAVTWNYLAASVLSLLLLKPSLQSLQSGHTPWLALLGLAVALPGIFLVLARAVREAGIEGLKLLVADMPGIPTYGYAGFLTWDEFYWTNWPGSENPYTQPYTHWGPFKYMTPFLEPTGN